MLDHVLSHFGGIDDLCVELPRIGWHYAIEIHVIFSQSACFVEAGKLYDSACDHFVLRNTEYLFLVESLEGIDYSKSHTDRQSRWNSNKNDID